MVRGLFSRMIKSIVIVRLSALGDVLMLVPLVRALQDHLPEVKITWIISKPAYFLVEGMDGVEFIVIDKPKSIGDYWRFKKMMQDRSFDVLLAPQASLRTNLLYPLIRATRKIGYDRHRANDGHGLFVNERVQPGKEHTLDGFLKFARALGIDDIKVRWDMPVTDADRQWALDHLPKEGRILVVNPAASKPERSWSVEGYITVIQALKAKHPELQMVLTGGPGPDDRRLADGILKQVDAVDLVGKTRPKQLLAVIEKATLVLCPDTGPSHMAAAMNTPVVALHAVTNPEISGPYTFRHYAINQYPCAVERLLNKNPETVAWGTQVHHADAMGLITPEMVIARCSQLLVE